MKILKLVLIAIVTVSIYSFTKNTQTIKTNEKTENKNNSYNCITFTYKDGVSEFQKEQARYCLSLTKGFNFLGIMSSTGRTETWIITYATIGEIPPNPLAGKEDIKKDDSDEGNPCQKKNIYIESYAFNNCIN